MAARAKLTGAPKTSASTLQLPSNRVSTSLIPSVHALYAEGDTVVAHFDAQGTARQRGLHQKLRVDTRFVAGLTCTHNAPNSDPSSLTALGVFEAMQSAARLILEQELGDLTIAVQGVGNVGARLCGLLHASGARLVVTDINWGRAEHMAHRFGARLVAPEDIGSVEADIFAPCAIGGTLDAPLIDSLRVGLVCGGADNQLASRADGFRLADRGIVYSPDYAVNSGGIIGVAGAYLGQSESEVAARVRKIGPRIVTVLKQARLERRPPEFVADAIASDIIAAAARRAA